MTAPSKSSAMHPLLRFTLDLFEPNQPQAQVDKGQIAPKKAADFSHPQANREVLLGQTRVAYAFNRGQRRSIGFSVSVDGLAVRAPKWVTLRDVDAALQAKASWILRKLHDSRERQTRLADQHIVWQDGAELPFLGQTLVLRLDPEHRFGAAGAQLLTEDMAAVPDQAAPTRQVLCVSLSRQATPEQIRDGVQAWLMRQAKRIFQERLDHFAPLLGVQWKKLSLSNAGTRWGSARFDGSIRLNWRLVHFKMSVLDYVVVHELSHLRVMDHSPRFWDTVRAVVPDYAAQRALLKSEAVPRWD